MAIVADHSQPRGPRGPSLFSSLWWLTREAVKDWSKDRASMLAAALSYYTLFSLSPLFIIAIAVAGLVFGRQAATDELVGQIREMVGEQGATAIQTVLKNASQIHSGIIATL